MLDVIGALEKNGYAYQAELPGGAKGDVNFAVRQFEGYGKLSGKSLDELRAGERVAVGDGKRDPLDFVLWKRANADEPAEVKWPSPWGEGRPGWHIECSAMSCSLLGKHFDIHGGGSDLQFPHHENEIAQSEGAYAKETGQPFVNVWMHNGFVRIDGEKMSKSLGNFFMIREVLKQFDAEVIRFFLLRAHYRSPVNYSDQHLEDARQGLVRLYTALAGAGVTTAVDTATSPALDLADLTRRVQNQPEAVALVQSFFDAMDDDFNTPVAVSALFELATLLNKSKDAALAAVLRQLAGALGLLGRVPTEFLQAATGSAGLGPEEIETLIAERAAAKKARDFAKADQIRDDLLCKGVVLEDSAAGTTWRRQ